MVMKRQLRVAIAAVFVILAAGCGAAAADEIPLVNGKHWTESSETSKKAYLIGIANLADVELTYGMDKPAADTQSIIPRLARGLKGQTLDTVRQGLDRWYAANPDKLQRPVIETIWFEMVIPGLKSNK